ncbi:MAG: class I SAM-dependent methyltransferase [Cytophagales bacterium]|nr:class I SAM-dependent methyltransferase [Bernardetiaceae bacterium]MDW8210704.1 class I SAM-dependent methyltransferase [Cytophagales bacterium]
MERKFYEEYYTLERTNWWFKVRNQILMDRIAQTTSQGNLLKILNIGAGTGCTSELLQQFGEVTSIEYDDYCVTFMQGKLPFEIQQGSILDLQFEDGSFDLVCAFDVIEHVEDDATAVREMKRVCRSGGYIIVSVPAFEFLWSYHDVVNHHHRRYTLSRLKKVFEENCLAERSSGKLVYCTYFNSLLFPPIAVFRLISSWLPQKLIRRGSGADNHVVPAGSPVNKLLEKVFAIERPLLQRGWRFPFGVSAMLVWQM